MGADGDDTTAARALAHSSLIFSVRAIVRRVVPPHQRLRIPLFLITSVGPSTCSRLSSVRALLFFDYPSSYLPSTPCLKLSLPRYCRGCGIASSARCVVCTTCFDRCCERASCSSLRINPFGQRSFRFLTSAYLLKNACCKSCPPDPLFFLRLHSSHTIGRILFRFAVAICSGLNW